MSSQLMTTEAAAKYLSMSCPTLERLRLVGGGPVFCKLTPGPRGAVRYRLEDLDTWVTARRVRSTSDIAGFTMGRSE